MKENLIKRKRLFIAVAVIAVVAVLIAATMLTSPKLTMKVQTYPLEAGEQLPEDVTVYAEFSKESYAAEASLDASKVDAGKIGSYEASINLKGKSYPFTVEVADTTAPEGTLKEDVLTVSQGTELKAADLVERVIDASNVEISFAGKDETLDETFLCEETGDTKLTVRLTDASGNVTDLVQKLHVSIPDETAPVISGAKDITVNVGTAPDYLKGVTAEDETDGDVTAKIVVDNRKVDVKKAGSYKVTYICKDEAGNEAAKEITVTVKKKAAANTASNTGNQSNTQQNTQPNTQPSSQLQPNNQGSSQPGSQPVDSGNNQSASQPDNSGSSQPGDSGNSQPAPQPEPTPTPDHSGDSDNNGSGEVPDWVDPSGHKPLTDEEYDNLVNNWPGGN